MNIVRCRYTRELLSTLQADNDRLQRRVAKWRDLATIRQVCVCARARACVRACMRVRVRVCVRVCAGACACARVCDLLVYLCLQSELKALRHEHVALAHQATETRQLAYQICTGHGRLNSNSSARLQLDAPAVKQTTLHRPLIPGGTAAVPSTSSAARQQDLNAGLRAAIVDSSHPPSNAKKFKAWGPQPTAHNKAKLSAMLEQGATPIVRPSSSQSYTRRVQRMSTLLSGSARDIKM